MANRTLKKLVASVLALSMVFTLAACGGASSGGAASSTETASTTEAAATEEAATEEATTEAAATEEGGDAAAAAIWKGRLSVM